MNDGQPSHLDYRTLLNEQTRSSLQKIYPKILKDCRKVENALKAGKNGFHALEIEDLKSICEKIEKVNKFARSSKAKVFRIQAPSFNGLILRTLKPTDI